jgi:hypothetical protein
MTVILNQPVSVITKYSHKSKHFLPMYIYWKDEVYKMTKFGYHHTFKQGDVLIHIFSVLCDHTFFKLRFNSANLNWFLEELYDEF